MFRRLYVVHLPSTEKNHFQHIACGSEFHERMIFLTDFLRVVVSKTKWDKLFHGRMDTILNW